MPELGRKYTCYSCHTKFYDLGKPVPLCPKCGADQRDADEAPVYTAPRRGRAVVEDPVEDDDLAPAAGPVASGDATDEDAEDDFAPAEDREEEADDEEEEEY
ncbi:MAG TPA: FYDLN acid domain-containing protein [Thermoanaerobaculia bacterium]